MQTGDVIGRYTIGPQIGQGAFGNIFTARDNETGLIYAIKNESTSAERKTLEFEYKILKRIQGSHYFPKFFEHGETNSVSYVIMELIGPSISSIIKNLPEKKLSISTGLRTSRHVLRAIKAFHNLGFLHRDIKPGNVLVRLSHSPPLCLVDFGLARIFRDQKTGEHIHPRQRTGFRGTKTYASLNSHVQNDLSRRDDLISWFYFTIDIISEGLPWKGIVANNDVALMKKEFNVKTFVAAFAPELSIVWQSIVNLHYEEDPDYEFIEGVINEMLISRSIKEDDPWDWEEFLSTYRSKLSEEFGVSLRIDGGSDAIPYYTELGLPPAIVQQIESRRTGLSTPLLRSRQYSQMQLSELNEKDDKCCC